MNTKNIFKTLSAFTVVALSNAFVTDQAHAEMSASETLKRDRAAILAMVGEFKVSFNFEETLTFSAEGKPSKPHVSNAHESVRIVSESDDLIQLQHLLVVSDKEGNQHVVKHWRQDWTRAAKEMVVYRGSNDWEKVAIPQDQQQGHWLQTVYMVDDSPRYSGNGRWTHIGEHSYWESNETWRPLPRRERKRSSNYTVLVGTNRHIITPKGWAHEQNNNKLNITEGGSTVIARETGLNTYERVEDYDFAVANTYWSETTEFWKVVRTQWDSLIETNQSYHIAKKVDGEKMYMLMLEIAEEYREGGSETLSKAVKGFHENMTLFVEEHPAKRSE